MPSQVCRREPSTLESLVPIVSAIWLPASTDLGIASTQLDPSPVNGQLTSMPE